MSCDLASSSLSDHFEEQIRGHPVFACGRCYFPCCPEFGGGPEEKAWVTSSCMMCQKTFLDENWLIRHLVVKHYKMILKGSFCSKCNQLVLKQNLSSHAVMIPHGKEFEKLSPQLCLRKYPDDTFNSKLDTLKNLNYPSEFVLKVLTRRKQLEIGDPSSKKWEDVPGQQGSQYAEGGNDKKMSEMVEFKVNDNSDIVTKRKFITEIFESQRKRALLESQRFKKPIVEGIRPLCGKVIERVGTSGGRIYLFCCLILQQMDYTLDECQALILAPTRKKSQEIENRMSIVAQGRGLKVVHAFVVRKTSVEEKNHVVVGTPADVLDLLKSNSLSPDNIGMFVLQDADQMLSLAVEDQIYDIINLLPSNLQLGVFTSSIPHELREFTKKLWNRSV